MVTSSLNGNMFHHQFVGSLTFQDLTQARQHVELHAPTPSSYTVLWDLREAILEFADEQYTLLATTVVNQAPQEPYKRAFLVSSGSHRERVERILGTTTVPWPWAVFENEQLAIEWMRR